MTSNPGPAAKPCLRYASRFGKARVTAAAAGAALLAAAVAVLLDRSRAAHRKAITAAA